MSDKSYGSLFNVSVEAPPAVVTRDMLQRAIEDLQRREAEAAMRRADRAAAWAALKLDYGKMTPEDGTFLGYCMQADAVHPQAAERAYELIEKYRRDR